MDYKRLTEEIKLITEIADGVPEPYRERCFEVLLQSLLTEKGKHPHVPEHLPIPMLPQPPLSKGEKIPVTTQIRLFMSKTGVTEADLSSILLYADDEIHFLWKPKPAVIAQGQIEWALLLALKKAILSNEISVDPEDVRKICQEEGFYDPANFASNFKKPKTAALFKGPFKKGVSQSLTDEGLNTLAKLVKLLAGKSE